MDEDKKYNMGYLFYFKAIEIFDDDIGDNKQISTGFVFADSWGEAVEKVYKARFDAVQSIEVECIARTDEISVDDSDTRISQYAINDLKEAIKEKNIW